MTVMIMSWVSQR